MFVGVCRLVLHLQSNGSLKGKRKILRSIIDRTRAKFNASVAEVGDNDNIKRATIGYSVVGNDSGHVDSMIGRINSFIDSLYLAPIGSVRTEVIPMGDSFGSDEISLPPDNMDWDLKSDYIADEPTEEDEW